MTGAAVFLIIFLIIIVLIGLGVGIYFIVRYEKKKNNPSGPSGSSGPSGNSGTSGTSGNSGTSGTSGTNNNNNNSNGGNSGNTGSGQSGQNFFGISPLVDPTKYLTYDNSSSNLTVKLVNTPTYPWSVPNSNSPPYNLSLTAPDSVLLGLKSPVYLSSLVAFLAEGLGVTEIGLLKLSNQLGPPSSNYIYFF